jgi:hypothetical protein
MTQCTLRALLTVATLLTSVTPASAGWILYRQESGVWRASGVYQDLKVCETEAKAMAEKLHTLAGCAPPSPVGTAAPRSPSAIADADFEAATKKCARRSGVQYNSKPGSRVTILGTDEQRFDFDKCMTKAGQDLK